MSAPVDEPRLVQRHTPVLVRFPEIAPGTSRKTQPGYPQVAPLKYDYHPRAIEILLEHANFQPRWRIWRGGKRTYTSEDMLKLMQKGQYKKDLKLLPGVGQLNREGFWLGYAAILKSGKSYPKTCYARVVHGEGINVGRLVVQYWYAYFYNDFWNSHEMDWETVMIVFKQTDRGPQPTVCAYSAHMDGHWLPWSEVEKTDDIPAPAPDGTHPIVYVANGSHANYFHGPALYRPASSSITMLVKVATAAVVKFAGMVRWRTLSRIFKPRLKREFLDYTSSWEEGVHDPIEARLIPPKVDRLWTGEWRWLNHKGRLGSPGTIPKLDLGDAAPVGPPLAGDRWNDPFKWIDLTCKRAEPRAEVLRPTALEP